MFEAFKQRSIQLERLDTGDYTEAEYARWQREIRWIHRVLGETRALRPVLLREFSRSPGDPVSVLDVGAGSGDILEAVGSWGGPGVHLIGADGSADAASAVRSTGFDAVRCDALKLPFEDRSIDIVLSCLTLHHFDDESAVALLSEMKRVARRRVIVVDLERSWAAYLLYRLLGYPLLQRFTFEDGSLSIMRGFRPEELEELARRAGFDDHSVKRSAAFRLVLSGI